MNALVPVQTTERGLAYSKFRSNIDALLQSRDSKHVAAVARANADLVAKTITASDVHQDSTMSNISVQYANDEYIGERLMPPVPVTKRSNVYMTYDKRSRLAYPSDELNERGEANEIDDSRGTDNYSVTDYGFANYLDIAVLENQDAPLNEMLDLTESIAEGIAFKREKRIATILQASANYGANTTAISGTDRWDDASGGTPIAQIQSAVAGLWSGRGRTSKIGFCGLEVYHALQRNPDILALFNNVKEGLATAQQVAGYFGLDAILVGAAREDTANAGQTASYSRIWGNHFGIVRVMKSPSTRTAAFGSTFRDSQDPWTNQRFDPARGKKGGLVARISVSEDHKIVAADTGFLLTDVIS